MKLLSLLIIGIVVLAVSIGVLLMAQNQLSDLPENPRALQLKTERENIEEIKDLAIYSLWTGIGLTSAAVGGMLWRVWRDRER